MASFLIKELLAAVVIVTLDIAGKMLAGFCFILGAYAALKLVGLV